MSCSSQTVFSTHFCSTSSAAAAAAPIAAAAVVVAAAAAAAAAAALVDDVVTQHAATKFYRSRSVDSFVMWMWSESFQTQTDFRH